MEPHVISGVIYSTMQRLSLALALCLSSFRAFAAISGTVINIDGAPVAGARVSIAAYEAPEARAARLLSASPAVAPIAATETDAKGAFSLESPKQAVVELNVFASGYVPLSRRVERDEDTGAVLLTRGEMRTGTISAGGKPVAHATVAIYYGQYEYLTRTNEQGRYEAPHPTRVRRMVVAHRDHAIDDRTFGFGAEVTPRDLNRTLTAGTKVTGRVVGSDGETGVANAALFVDRWPVATSGEDGSFTIAHMPARWNTLSARKENLAGQRAFSKDATTAIRLAKAATISGRVTAVDGKTPVAGAIVAANIGRSGWGDTAQTDAKGAYSLVVAPGNYMLSASHPAYEAGSADVSVAAAQAATRDLSIAQLARVTGVVIDDEKRPVAAARLSPEETTDPRSRMFGRMMRMDETTFSGADGRFSIRVVADRPFQMRASRRGLPAARSESFRLTAGERKTGLVLTIPSGIAVTGRVTDTSGKPLSGVAVRAVESEPRGGGFVRTVFVGGDRADDAVHTATDGTFALRVKEGMYEFQFAREGLAPKTVAGQNVRADAPPTTIETTMEPSADISGRVIRAGVGIEGVTISAFGPGLDASAVTGTDGSFMLAGLAEGSVRVMLRKEDDFIQETRTFTAPARDVIVELSAGGRVTGRVIDKSSGKPITQFQAGLSTSRSSGSMSFSAPPQLQQFTSDDGSFTLEHVPPGATVLIATAPGYASTRLNVTVEEGKTLSDVELPLDQGVRLTGRVTGPNGSPLADVRVHIAPSPSGVFSTRGSEASATTDANGEYTLEALLAGEETISFTHAKYAPTSKQVTLKGREAKLDVQLSAGLRITGTVVTEAGAPVADARVDAMSSSGGMESARTNASGSFEIEGLKPGRYRFMAAKSGAGEGRLDDVDVSSGAPVRITIQSGATIYGRVTGLPERDLGSVIVEARAGRSNASASPDSTGSYRIEGAPTGTVQVSAYMMPGAQVGQRRSGAQTIEVEAGGSQNVDIAFRSDVTIRGRVTRNDAPLKNASVNFWPRRGSRAQASASTTTDESGNYSVSGLDEGEYSVDVIDMQRYSPYATTYAVGGSATFDIDFRTGSVRGRIVDASSGEPIANAALQLRPAADSDSSRNSRNASSDAAGAFVIDAVPAGSYVATASKEGFGIQAVELNVTEAGADGVEVKLSRNEGVTLRVVDGRDRRRVRAAVTVYDMQGRLVYESLRFFPGDDEAAEIKLPLASGTYTAAVNAMGYASRNIRFQSPSVQTVPMTPGGTLLIRSKHSDRRRIRLIDANGIPYQRFGSAPPSRDLLPRPGTTTVLSVAPGGYTLQLLGEDDALLDSKQVSVQEGQSTETEI